MIDRKIVMVGATTMEQGSAGTGQGKYDDLLKEAREFALKASNDASYDGSHDWHHVMRVAKNAKDIAEHENFQNGHRSRTLVQVIALLHDVADSKYKGYEARARELQDKLGEWTVGGLMTEEHKYLINFVISIMSFKDESKGSCAGLELPTEFKVVQDADRLDAIGAVGIARCFMFGGSRGSEIIRWEDPSRGGGEVRGNGKAIPYKTCVGHFYEKLLKLKDMMKTRRGAELAGERHEVMVKFLATIESECDFYSS